MLKKVLFIGLTLFHYTVFAQSPADTFVTQGNSSNDQVVIWESSGLIVARYYEGTGGTWDPPLASPPDVLGVGTNFGVSASINDAGDVLATWTHDGFPNRAIIAARYEASSSNWSIYPALSDALNDNAVISQVHIDDTSNGRAVWTLDDGTLQSSLYDAVGDTWSATEDLNS